MYSKQKASRSVKATFNPTEQRRKREEQGFELRKTKKEEILTKRRRQAGAPMQDEAVIKALQELPQMVAALRADNPEIVIDATTQFRKLLSTENNPPIDRVVAAGVVPIFVSFLERYDLPQLQFESAWALTNIASGTANHTQLIVGSGAVPLFIQLVNSPVDDVREQAVWALGNIAGDSPACRDFVLRLGAMAPVLSLISSGPKPNLLRNATWALSNLCRGKPIPDFAEVSPAIPVLANLLYHQDPEVLTDACWAISYISDGPNERIQQVLDHGIVRRLVQLLVHPEAAVQTPALRTIGNIVTGDDEQTQAVLNCGCLTSLLSLLGHPKKNIRKEACWTISNVTAGNDEQIEHVVHAGLFPPLIGLLASSEYDVKREAIWALSNATSGGNPAQIKYLVECGCLPAMCELLETNDTKIITVALEGIENILKTGEVHARNQDGENMYANLVEECGGLTKIENLQYMNNNDIYEKAMKIIEVYYGIDGYDEGESYAPAQQGGMYDFGSNVSAQRYSFN